MNENQDQTWEDVTLKSLEAKLRSLPDPGIPERFEGRLHAAIPNGSPEAYREHPVRRWLGAYSLWASAAAILVLVLVLTLDHGPSTPSQGFVADLNDRASRHVPNDQNAVLIEDTNLVNNRIEQRSP